MMDGVFHGCPNKKSFLQRAGDSTEDDVTIRSGRLYELKDWQLNVINSTKQVLSVIQKNAKEQ